MAFDIISNAEGHRATAIYLEHGADEAECDPQTLEVGEHGMSFQSRWAFEIGSHLGVVLCPSMSLTGSDRFRAVGIVAECEKIGCDCYRTTIYFLDQIARTSVG